MITLEAATEEAFRRRRVKIEPLLTVYEEDGTPRSVSPLLLKSRPARSANPITSANRTPVVRLDLDVAANAASRELFQDQRRIVYKERFNGQVIQLFDGRIVLPEGSWDASTGVVVEQVRVIAYSPSQRLADMQVEQFHFATTNGPAAGEGASCVLVGRKRQVYLTAGGTSTDLLPAAYSTAIDPNLGAWDDDCTGLTVELEAGTQYDAPADVEMVVSGAQLAIEWQGAPPSAGTVYKVTYWELAAGVIPTSYTSFTATATPATPVSFAMDEDLSEFAPEQIDSDRLDYVRVIDPAASFPRAFTRVGFGTGAPTEAPAAAWSWDMAKGQFTYGGSQALVFGTSSFSGSEIGMLGFMEVAWADASLAANSTERQIAALYEQAGIVDDAAAYTGLGASGITAANFRSYDNGARVLKSLMDATPPNYVLRDGEDGLPIASLVTQKATADFSLIAPLASRQKDRAQVVTLVRVMSQVVEGLDRGLRTEPVASDADEGWDDRFKVYDGDPATYATPKASASYGLVELRNPVAANQYARVKTVTIRFEGELRVYRRRAYLGEAKKGADGYERIVRATASEVTLEFDDSASLQPLAGWNPGAVGSYESIRLEFQKTAEYPAPKLYSFSYTVDMFTVVDAVLTDDSSVADDSAWHVVSRSVGSTYVRRVAASFLARWMANPQSYADAGDDLYAEWWRHRVTILEDGGYYLARAVELAQETMNDVLRRATSREVDVVCDHRAQIGDTVALYDPTLGETILRTIVGFRDGTSFERPTTTLELADYT